MRLRSEAFQERSRQARLSDARFTGQQDDLTLATLRFRPATQQHFEFFFASDKFGKAGCVEGIKAALDGSWSQRRPGAHWADDALKVVAPKVLKLEQVAHELPSALRNHHPVRLRNALQSRRKVRCLANDGLLLRSARADQIADNHEPCSDAYTGLKGRRAS